MRGEDVNLVQADAREWLRKNYRLRFDLVIDDLFGENQHYAHRAVMADTTWF